MALRVVEVAGLTDVGRQREANEDNLVVAAPVFAVADGMGGARAGEVASQIAAETFGELRGKDGTPEQRLTWIAKLANRRIYELALGRLRGITRVAERLGGDLRRDLAGARAAHPVGHREDRRREHEVVLVRLALAPDVAQPRLFDHSQRHGYSW